MTFVRPSRAVRVALLALAISAPGVAFAQVRPTAQEAQVLLQTRPDLIRELRQRVIRSGMTAEDVRARLRAEGYPENLLDAYLPGSSAAPDSVGQDVLAALQKLGISDSTSGEGIGPRLLIDSTRADSGRVPPLRVPEAPRAITPSDEPDSKPGDETKIFGLDVFRRRTTQFDPNLAGPIDANYRVGPGDRLALLLTGQLEAAYTLDVTREGYVVVPQVGRIDVANLTMSQLETLFYDRLGKVYSEVRRGPEARTRFSISPVALRSNQVFVIGDVVNPGSYRVSGAGTVLTALYAAGGPTATGTMRAIEIRRGGRVAARLDLYGYVLRGEAGNDLRLENGDVIFVGVHGPRVQLAGEVVRPATYELKASETLADLVAGAGGLKPTASRQRIQIERLVPATTGAGVGNERQVIDVASAELLVGTIPPVGMRNGDIVRVFAISKRVRSSVQVVGHVWSPGRVAFIPGLRLSAALSSVGSVKPGVYIGQVVVTRTLNDSSSVRVYSAFRDSTGALTEDLALQEDDEVRVFSVTEFRQERHVAIAGAVRRPGQYPYKEGMTMRDLILQSGGLHERALLTEAELAQMPNTREGGLLAQARRVPMDSTYLFERAPDGRYLGPPGLPAPKAVAPEVSLRAYDNVTILEQPDWGLPRIVAINGEVKLPGSYALLKRTDKVSDLIARAGGLTERAYPAGVVFIRNRDQIGRIGIDLPRVLKNPKFRDNLQLEDGDNVFVPPYRATVVVSGAVNSPVAVSYVPGRDVDWYINAAGGPSLKADAAHAWVVQPNGSVQSRRSRFLAPAYKPTPQPGSNVRVPEKDPNAKHDTLQIMASIAQVLASLVAIVAVASR